MTHTGDQRDATTWVVLELSRQGEIRCEEGTLSHHIREALRVGESHPIFLPSATYTANGQSITLHLMEGYAFIASGLPEASYLKLEDTPYVRRVLTTRNGYGMRVLSVVPDTSVASLRDQLRQQIIVDISVGMQVRVTEGMCASLDAEVLELDGEHAHVHIPMRSLDLIARIPRMFIIPLGGAT